MHEPRKLALRPSKPQAQALKNRNIRETKAATASRRMRRSTRKLASVDTDEQELSAEQRRECESDFRNLWDQLRDDAERFLDEAGVEKLIHAARAIAFKTISSAEWITVLGALNAARKAAEVPEPVKRWKPDFYNRPDGW